MTDRPTPYAELADVVGNLPLLLREARRARGLSQRAAATEIGVAFSTVHRIEAGQDCVLSNAVAVLRWLDQAPARLAGESTETPLMPTPTVCPVCHWRPENGQSAAAVEEHFEATHYELTPDEHDPTKRMVAEFHRHVGAAIRSTPTADVPGAEMRVRFVEEETRELREAVEARDIVAVADALADLAYVVYGAALHFGIPLSDVLAEVHRSNMTKTPAGDGKAIKGLGYRPPDIAGLIDTRAQPVSPDFNPAYRVARCGQQSHHGPHVMEHGPDQPRNCPGTGTRRNPWCSNCGDTRGGPVGHEISECQYRPGICHDPATLTGHAAMRLDRSGIWRFEGGERRAAAHSHRRGTPQTAEHASVALASTPGRSEAAKTISGGEA